MIVTASRRTARRFAESVAGAATEVHLVVTPDDCDGLAGLALGRRDRVEWLAGWCDGEAGRALARRTEVAAATGAFGGARHGFGRRI